MKRKGFCRVLGFWALVGGADAWSALCTGQAATRSDDAAVIPNRAKVPGKLRLRQRSRVETRAGSGEYQERTTEVDWNVAETAIIICDMWDDHYCRCAKQRVNAMAPRVNQVITAARSHGVQIIHAPSGTMKTYQDTEFRKRMLQAPHVEPPVPIQPGEEKRCQEVPDTFSAPFPAWNADMAAASAAIHEASAAASAASNAAQAAASVVCHAVSAAPAAAS